MAFFLPITPAATVSLSVSSSFRRYVQRDERRRRLMTDDLYEKSGGATCRVWSDVNAERKSENYGDAEFLDQQIRLLDLIPRRVSTLLILLTAVAAAAVALEFAYVWMAARTADGAGAIAALDLAAKGSLGSWLASLLLLTAAVAAMLIYTVRRHRTDDYQGRYHVWIWAAGGCFLLAADRATGLHEAFRKLMVSLTGTTLIADGDFWWIVAYVVLFGAIGSRVLIDMRRCVPAAVALCGAVIAQMLCIAGMYGWGFFDGPINQVVYLSGAGFAADLLLLAAFGFFARHVILDAEGLLSHRQKRESEDREKEESEFRSAGPGRWRKIDPPHAVPKPAHQLTPKPATPAPVARKLTKAEKKALRKRLLAERQQRERKCG